MSCPGCTIEIFSDTDDEGHLYEGAALAGSGSGAFTWSGRLHGPNVTATATMPSGATSAFSDPFGVGPCVVPRVFLPLVKK
jgi:hypothetical protein